MDIREALGQIDVLLANTDEATALTGFTDPAQALAALAEVVDTAVIKCGLQGALAGRGAPSRGRYGWSARSHTGNKPCRSRPEGPVTGENRPHLEGFTRRCTLHLGWSSGLGKKG